MQSYEVTARNGYKYTIQATEEDAKRLGLDGTNKLENKKVVPENKAHTEQPDEKTAEQAKPVKRPGAQSRRK